MTKAALIDLGTNSVRLIIVKVEEDGSPMVAFQEKQPVSLGESSFTSRHLTKEAIDRTIDALRAMVKTAHSHKVDEIRAVATSATRDAENRSDFLEQVEHKTGLRLKVISGLEEARLVYAGMAHNLNLRDAPGLLVDIGGGSLELIIGDRHGHYELDSLPLGAARLAERFNLTAHEGRVSGKTYRQMFNYAVSHSRHFAEKAKGYDLTFCYGSSGTIENLVRLNARRHGHAAGARGYPPLPASALAELAEWLGPMTLGERKKADGLEARKADTILAGGAVLEAVLKTMNIKAVTAVDYGLKHGLLFDLIADRAKGPDHMGAGLRENSVRRLGRRCRYDEGHAETVAALALAIFDALVRNGLLKASPRDRELLRLAALLHDIGQFLSYQNHNIHSHYLIKNSDLLGFDEDEVDCLAFLALSHRKRKKNVWPHSLYEDDPRPELPRWRKLAFILHLAELLDSRRQGGLMAIDFRFEPGQVFFLFPIGPGQNFDPEMEALHKNVKTFQNLFESSLAVGPRV
ncbi:MAG: Ppx/GppA family phosphatase [Candidatus Adiutrix sp.]|jgi:exopolyphosphatase/guanosine-5'-triphosphate,3'-diphosphate pyrophosphatase|nr:Ppx/GppA family phosphatase [Candidatus Adiutrix sp.]